MNLRFLEQLKAKNCLFVDEYYSIHMDQCTNNIDNDIYNIHFHADEPFYVKKKRGIFTYKVGKSLQSPPKVTKDLQSPHKAPKSFKKSHQSH